MNTNTSRFEKNTHDPRLWENERRERVFILGTQMKDVRASKTLLSPMIDAVIEANAQGKSAVEVRETRGF